MVHKAQVESIWALNIIVFWFSSSEKQLVILFQLIIFYSLISPLPGHYSELVCYPLLGSPACCSFGTSHSSCETAPQFWEITLTLLEPLTTPPTFWPIGSTVSSASPLSFSNLLKASPTSSESFYSLLIGSGLTSKYFIDISPRNSDPSPSYSVSE